MSYLDNDSMPKRERQLTEKGRLYMLGQLQHKRSKLEKDIRKKLNFMNSLMENNKPSMLRQERSKLDELFKQFMAAHGRCQLLIEGEDKTDDEGADKLDRDIMKHKRQVSSWLSLQGSDDERASSLKSKSSRKSKSSKSSGSSRSERIKEEKAKLAELQVEAEYIELQRLSELRAVEIQKKAEIDMKKLKVEMEMAKANAKLKVYEEDEELKDVAEEEIRKNILDDIPFDDSYTENYVTDHLLKPSYDDFLFDTKIEAFPSKKEDIVPSKKEDIVPSKKEEVVPSKKEEVVPSKKEEVALKEDSALNVASLVRELQAPEVELDTFSGNPTDFHYFMSTFVECVEKKVNDPFGRLTRLIKYMKGDTKDLIKSCVYLPPSTCYIKAKGLLQEKYGDPYRIMAGYRKQLMGWPKIKANEPSALMKFYNFVLKFEASLSFNPSLSTCSPEILQILQSKLPTYIQDKWNRAALKIRQTSMKEASLADFLKLLDLETKLVNDPLYSREAISDLGKHFSYDRQPAKVVKSNFIEHKDIKCPSCKKNHDLEKCKDYLKLKVEDRRKFLFQKRLCFCCLRPTSLQHSAKTCKQRKICSECKEAHPTSLHGYRKEEKEDKKDSQEGSQSPSDSSNVVKTGCVAIEKTSCLSSKCQYEIISLCIVPVKLYHRSKPGNVLDTYALLDNGSQGSFILESLATDLKIHGSKTSLSIKTVNGERKESCTSIDGIVVMADDNNSKINLPRTYTKSSLPVDGEDIPTVSKIQKWKYLDCIHDKLLKDVEDCNIGMIIGANCPKALEPLETIPSQKGGPFAFRSRLGWCVVGPMLSKKSPPSTNCNRISLRNSNDTSPASSYFSIHEEFKDVSVKEMLLSMYNIDFSESVFAQSKLHQNTKQKSVSLEDKTFVSIMENEVKHHDGHYYLPLPLRHSDVQFPNNKIQANQRAEWLKRRLLRNEKMLKDYIKFVNNLLSNGYAVKAEEEGKIGRTWYLPHHGVYHPHKPEKIRIVFDCSAEFKGFSFNNQMLQGPDLINHLVGVLLRFRSEPIAVMGDIDSMYYQVRIPEEQHDLMRFVWWPNGDLTKELQDFKMCVHMFGGICCPSAANFAIKKTADDFEDTYGHEAASTLRRDFYVDDWLKSCPNVNSAIKLISDVKAICKAGGFTLTKFTSNSREVLQSIPPEQHSKQVQSLDLNIEELPVERVLGIKWFIEQDIFGFKIVLPEKPMTRRGILASVSSIYDPLGLAAPVLLKGKKLLQQICSEKAEWDDNLSSDQLKIWNTWKEQLPLLEKIQVKRCFKPKNFGVVKNISVHHFSDASDQGYGQVSYLRYENFEGQIHCSIIMGKSRVAPLKKMTIPRLELTAAFVSVKVAVSLREELDLQKFEEFFWTDSQVVLAYISNDKKRYQLFVANRVQYIRENSSLNQWKYVPTKLNPADDASRGLSGNAFLKNQRWLCGPEFLWKQEKDWPNQNLKFTLDENDKEVKKIKANPVIVNSSDDLLQKLESITTNWFKLRRIVAVILKWKDKSKTISVEDMKKAEIAILKLVQLKSFGKEIELLQRHNSKSKSVKLGCLHQLDPFIDDNGIIRVGGRINKSDLEFEEKHPIILPKRSKVTNMIIAWFHRCVQHSGRGITMCEIRRNGFWVINGNSLVRYLISKCVVCRSLRGKTEVQKMANLPTDRLEPSPPFSFSGLDMFGPFIIKEGRKNLKRYGIIFTCLASRAVHIETVNSMETNSFILSLRRFIGRRGNVRSIRSDNGSNFVGAENELRRAFKEMDQEKISNFLLTNGADWICEWKRNPPYSSHFGGVWERQIRSVRSILSAILKNHGSCLDDESLRTFLVEAEAIINCRPLSVETLNDTSSPTPISPANLLTTKSSVILPPPGQFQKDDIYCRKRWRRVQYLCNQFWKQWQKQYLQNLQLRHKWTSSKRNLRVGDIVLIKDDDLIRNEWKMAIIESINVSDDKIVRSATVKTNGSSYVRPISKLVLLLESEFPDEEPKR